MATLSVTGPFSDDESDLASDCDVQITGPHIVPRPPPAPTTTSLPPPSPIVVWSLPRRSVMDRLSYAAYCALFVLCIALLFYIAWNGVAHRMCILFNKIPFTLALSLTVIISAFMAPAHVIDKIFC